MLCVFSLFFIGGSAYTFDIKSDELHASTITFAAGDEVNVGSDAFEVINFDGSTLNLLGKTASETESDWTSANTKASEYANTLGELTKKHVTSKLPTTSDLTSITSGSSLTSISPYSGKWWLGDASVDNRSKVVTANNALDGEFSIPMNDPSKDDCNGETKEAGVLPTSNWEDPAVTGPSSDAKYAARIAWNTSTSSVTASLQAYGIVYDSSSCSGDILLEGNSFSGWSYPGNFVLDSTGNPVYETDVNSAFMRWSIAQGGGENAYAKIPCDYMECGNGYVSYNVPTGTCIDIGDGFSFKANGGSVIGKAAFYDIYLTAGTSKTCPAVNREAGKALTRIDLRITSDSISEGYNSALDLSSNSVIDKTVVTKGTKYLAFNETDLTIALTPGKNVNGNILSASTNENNVIDIPLTLGGSTASIRNVLAIATDINGNEVYSNLGTINETTGNVELDYSNLKSDNSNEFNITLYQLVQEGNTYFQGTGQTVTLKLVELPTIEFDTNTVSKMSYGTNTTITAKVTSTLSEAADTPITFSLVDATNKAEIVKDSMSYDKTTGIAQATIKQLSGNGKFKIAIDKAASSDGTIPAATQVVKEITLEQKEITIHPTKFESSFAIGDTMPSITSETDGLVGDDELPAALIPQLVGMDASTPPSPASSGKVANSGIWKLQYASNVLDSLTAFTDKYKVTLEDYDDDDTKTHCYVFKSGVGAVADDWISITPNANAKGWNKGTVTIAPSQKAKDAGYTLIALMNGDSEEKSGATIEYNIETAVSGVTPTIRLKNGTILSDTKQLRNIKIDITNPTGSASVANENTWVKDSKLVTVTTNDALSGVASVTVKKGSSNVSVTEVTAGSKYTFTATENDTYSITVKDNADNEEVFTKVVSKIDAVAPTLTVTEGTLADDKSSQDINVTRTVGTSGIKTIKVYYRKTASDTYDESKAESLAIDKDPLTYKALKSGIYKFEVTNNADNSASEEIQISKVIASKPIVEVSAKQTNGIVYEAGTWVNQDVEITLENSNDMITDAITYFVKKGSESDWTELPGNTYTSSTTTWLKETYYFKAMVGIDSSEEKQLNVKIDKELPNNLQVKNGNNYSDSNWFIGKVDVEVSYPNKASGANQTLYVKNGTTGTWEELSAKTYSVMGNGKHEISFKLMDEAGNESAISGPYIINISDTAPSITISLDNNAIKDLINNLTFGFFFKDKVDVKLEADFGAGQTGDIFYIIDTNKTSTMPKETDSRWVKGTSTSINPDTRAMIYVKAKSKAGVVAFESSQFDVVADKTNPNIHLPSDATKWTKTTSMDVKVDDATAGFDPTTATYQIDSAASKTLSLTNGTGKITSLKDGEYPVSIQISDYSGNVASASTKVKIDNVAPTNVTVNLKAMSRSGVEEFLGINDWKKGSQVASFSATDDHSTASQITYKVAIETNGVVGNWVSYKADKTLNISQFTKLHVKAIDEAGNESATIEKEIALDNTAPKLTGVEAGYTYQYYKAGRTLTYEDLESGIKTAQLQRNSDPKNAFASGVNIQADGTYVIALEDNVGNITNLTFTMKALPSMDTIDGSDETKAKIDNVQKEAQASKDAIEKADMLEWVKDALNKWDSLRKKVVENEESDAKVEGKEETTFDPDTILITEVVEEEVLPILPRKALASYSVYLKKGDTIVQPNGMVKVYLPYNEKEAPIVYEIDENGKVTEIKATVENGKVVFETNRLLKYAISNIKQEAMDDGSISVPGPDGKEDTSDDVIAKPSPDGDKPTQNPDGTITVPPGGSVVFPGGKEEVLPDGGILNPDGSVTLPDGSTIDPDGNKKPKPNQPNIDSDDDEKADINVDIDGDGKGDINIDLDGDGIPDINIDTDGDGKPDYNVDTDGDGKADLNIGPKPNPWKPNVCYTVNKVEYCTMNNLRPNLNIDTNKDGYPDVNVDLDDDGIADINIDTNLDNIPDIDIDNNGDGKADINIDRTGNGKADENIVEVKEWKPTYIATYNGMKYGTMKELVYKEDGTGNSGDISNGTNSNTSNGNNQNGTSVKGNYKGSATEGALTGDDTNIKGLLTLMVIVIILNSYILYRKRKI